MCRMCEGMCLILTYFPTYIFLVYMLCQPLPVTYPKGIPYLPDVMDLYTNKTLVLLRYQAV